MSTPTRNLRAADVAVFDTLHKGEGPTWCPEHNTELDRHGECFACRHNFDPSEDPAHQGAC